MQNVQPEEHPEYEYAGFWLRTGACLIDSLFFSLILLPVLVMFYGTDYFYSDSLFRGTADIAINWIVPAILTVVLWRNYQATPGKMALRLRVLDAESGHSASTGQYIGRYLGYFVSTVPMGLGFLWVAFDRRKQGWHDKLAGTVVVRELRTPPVKFRSRPSPRR
ncbi:RDD family protein [Salmonella enterica]|uniref:RDD family protein n=1 Tax=Salmonella diarizonae TaxID=59204 RepID=A0A5Y1YEM8_SALDZ|nr:RDD family protein [Salmonella enterica]EBS3850697.1 RDD family protein [Salmonella enterica subsp. enterica serovar Java]ECB2072179.1 RDD family protein [Salmonella enterica subsp. enterica serovar Benin]ECC3917321.1 RDD family protein [Salmonella enterica subsp. diarizonae]EDX3987259.1 RDD family protein [Salmonella enterica subsp. enterica serovar 4,[5],12:b:-]EEE5613349.1 RDD family protein [Salmonella enterica subsp. enterica serovar Typhimurium]EEE9947834.1 RDD family protein [Salmon